MNGLLGIQAEANRQAMERDAMNVRGGMLREDPGLMQRFGSQAKRLFFGDKNMYGNDPLYPSVMDSQYIRPEMAEGALLDVVGGPMATAWHGSPHLFKKFDMSKIGTGEGAQAYGHGLYFAENPKVAKEYANTVGQPKSNMSGSYHSVDDFVDSMGASHQSPEEMAKDYAIESAHEAGYGYGDEEIEAALDFLRETGGNFDYSGARDLARQASKELSNLYKVDIPDDQIAKMLDWDAPLSKSFVKREPGTSPSREQALSRAAVKEGRAGEGYYEDLIDLYGEGGRVPRNMAQQEVSEYLRLQGIPGIKYLDGGSRSGGKGTSNFVLFDDQIPQILEINGKPLKGILGE